MNGKATNRALKTEASLAETDLEMVEAMDTEGFPGDPTLIGEALLAEVLRRLPFEDRLKTVPLVCKGWRNVSNDPACWRSVDMNGWFRKKAEEEFMWEFDEVECEQEMELYIKKVVDRSNGQLKEFRTMHCTDAAIDYIAEHCPQLTIFSMPSSLNAMDASVQKLAEKCPNLQELDLSDCYKITNTTIEAFGRNCGSLVSLARNMVRVNEFLSTGPAEGGDMEACAVSQHLPNLKHLELQKSTMTDMGLAHIARGCKELESLNLACCTLSPHALEQVAKVCPNLKDFVQPIVPRMHVNPKFLMVLLD